MDTKKPPSDNPIRTLQQDLLERKGIAKRFAQHILRFDANEGAVASVIGPWGSGKTSFINLAKKEFEEREIYILDFNPWLFSGSDQLIKRFFSELSTAIMHDKKMGWEKIVGTLENYSDVIEGALAATSKIPAPGVALASDAISAAVKHLNRSKSVTHLRDELTEQLGAKEKPIVIVIDDIDRLSTSEILDIFKMVRLTASFPNLIYILVFDRVRVEEALEKTGYKGSDYIDKIVQFHYHLPNPPKHLLERQIFTEIYEVRDRISPEPLFNQLAWHDVYPEIVGPLFRNMRDVRRYTAAIECTMITLGNRIEAVDVLALDAIRLFRPEIFDLMPAMIETLAASTSDKSGQKYIEELKSRANPESAYAVQKDQIKKLLVAEEHAQVKIVANMIRRLFPFAMRYLPDASENDASNVPNSEGWVVDQALIERRIAHEDIFRLYLECAITPGLATHYDAERALERMGDKKKLMEFMQPLGLERALQVISELKVFSDEFHPEHIEPSIVVFYNLLPKGPKNPSSILASYDYQTHSIEYIAGTLLDKAPTVDAMVENVWAELETLSSKLTLINLIGRSKPVSKEKANEFRQRMLSEIVGAPAHELAEERNIFQIISFARKSFQSVGELWKLPDSSELVFAILWDTHVQMTINAIDDRQVFQEHMQSQWQPLIILFGDESELKRSISHLRENHEGLSTWLSQVGIRLSDADKLLDAVADYAEGRIESEPHDSHEE